MATSLPLFGPKRDPGSEGLYTVSELNARIRAALEDDFAEIGVRGEVSNLARPGSGHVYFSLKDGASQIRAVMWKQLARRMVFSLENGLSVRAWGGITVYEPRGEYQLVVARIEPAGMGALELAFRQLYDRLAAEGLFDEHRKRPLPRFPKRIAVVTSPTGDAVRDVIRVAGQRWPLAELLIVPSRVQGAGAALELISALKLANQIEQVDLIILTRGGGSMEDLWAFNDEALVRAIAASKVPVVSAVGHERDFTLCDYAADLRAPTPSAAALLSTPDRFEITQTLDLHGQRLGRRARGLIDFARLRLENLARRARDACRLGIERRRSRLDAIEPRFHAAMQRRVQVLRERVERLGARLDALSPYAVLARGYSLTILAENGRVVRDPTHVKVGEQLITRLARGTLTSRVENTGES